MLPPRAAMYAPYHHVLLPTPLLSALSSASERTHLAADAAIDRAPLLLFWSYFWGAEYVRRIRVWMWCDFRKRQTHPGAVPSGLLPMALRATHPNTEVRVSWLRPIGCDPLMVIWRSIFTTAVYKLARVSFGPQSPPCSCRFISRAVSVSVEVSWFARIVLRFLVQCKYAVRKAYIFFFCFRLAQPALTVFV